MPSSANYVGLLAIFQWFFCLFSCIHILKDLPKTPQITLKETKTELQPTLLHSLVEFLVCTTYLRLALTLKLWFWLPTRLSFCLKKNVKFWFKRYVLSKCAFIQRVKVSFLYYSIIILYISNSYPYLVLALPIGINLTLERDMTVLQWYITRYQVRCDAGIVATLLISYS